MKEIGEEIHYIFQSKSITKDMTVEDEEMKPGYIHFRGEE